MFSLLETKYSERNFTVSSAFTSATTRLMVCSDGTSSPKPQIKDRSYFLFFCQNSLCVLLLLQPAILARIITVTMVYRVQTIREVLLFKFNSTCLCRKQDSFDFKSIDVSLLSDILIFLYWFISYIQRILIVLRTVLISESHFERAKLVF